MPLHRDAAGGDGPVPAQVRQAERFALVGAAVFVVGFGVAARTGQGAVLNHILALGISHCTVLLGLTMISLTARAVRWHALTCELDIRSAWRDSLLCYLAGFVFTLTPGRAGEAVRLWIVRRRHGTRYERTVGLLIADRVSDALALSVLIAVSAWTFKDRLGLTAMTSLVVVGLAAALMRPAWAMASVNAAYVTLGRRRPRLFARLRTMLRQTQRLMSGSVFAWSTLLVVVGWFAEAASLYWLLRVMGAGIEFLPVAFALGIAMLVGALSMLPGGLGGTEATLVALLLDHGVGLDTALAATVVFRVATLWFTIGIAVLSLPFILRTLPPR
jgi:glycosyltransferase 2 family protein